jgi:hypothetical protein
MFVKFDLSVGDFLDRMSIAEIKKEKIGGEHVTSEFTNRFSVTYDLLFYRIEEAKRDQVLDTYNELHRINSKLWEVEDLIRNATEDFEVAELSRQIISLNDSRAFHKRAIDQYFGFGGDVKKYSGAFRNYTV